MTRWYPVVLLALSGWLTSTASAQGPFGPGGPPPGMLPGPPNPADFSGAGYGPGYGPAYTSELVPDMYDQLAGFNRRQRNASQIFNGAWIRADYLLWSMQGPGNTLLGAPMATFDPNSAFSAVDPVNGVRLDAQGLPVVAIVPNLAGTQLRNINGAIIGLPTDNRASFDLTAGADTSQINGARIAGGMPLYDGMFEAEAWTLQQAQTNISLNPTSLTLSGTTLIPALTLLENRLPSDTTMILFSENYNTTLTTNVWGTEGNYAFATPTPGSDIEITPLLGFRYMRLGEKLGIAGADIPDPINFPGAILNHRINTSMQNHIFGPQVGFRAQLRTRFVTLGFEPKLAATVNRVRQDLSTQEIYRPTGIDPLTQELARTQTDQFTQFSPTLDLAFYAKVNVSQNFSLNVGYDYMLTGSVYRAYDNIAYNSPATTGDAPTIGLQQDRSNVYVHGLMIGGEYTFR